MQQRPAVVAWAPAAPPGWTALTPDPDPQSQWAADAPLAHSGEGRCEGGGVGTANRQTQKGITKEQQNNRSTDQQNNRTTDQQNNRKLRTAIRTHKCTTLYGGTHRKTQRGTPETQKITPTNRGVKRSHSLFTVWIVRHYGAVVTSECNLTPVKHTQTHTDTHTHTQTARICCRPVTSHRNTPQRVKAISVPTAATPCRHACRRRCRAPGVPGDVLGAADPEHHHHDHQHPL